MSERSSIEWTDSTWNPVTGCTKISPGCKHCYAETFAERFRGVPNHPYELGFDLRLWPQRIALPLKWKKPRKIFVTSMSDLFHENVPDSFIDQIFDTMHQANWHQFQILTKRPERMFRYLESRESVWGTLSEISPHIWLGTSIETQRYMKRANVIGAIRCSVRFLSCEPLLGPLNFRDILNAAHGINWVIVGGESGPKSRPMKSEWVHTIRDQCLEAKIPFFFKQWGGPNKKLTGRLLDNRTWDEIPNVA